MPSIFTKLSTTISAGSAVWASLIMLCMGCSGDDTANPDGPLPGSPVFLSFGTNTNSLTEGESIIFTAVLTDPDGIDDLIGGSLTNSDGTLTYGAFVTTGQEGAYALTVTWAGINQVEEIGFEGESTRSFVAEFF